jgi:cytochrome c peroxidase
MRWISLILLSCAGIIHLLIAPDHFSHAPAHGMFFAVVGLVQLTWAIIGIVRRDRMSLAQYTTGILLSGGVIVVWLLSHLVAVPFAVEQHPLDMPAVVTKAAELTAFATFLGGYRRWGGSTPRAPKMFYISPTLVPLLGGFLVWGSAMLITLLFPGLVQVIGHTHASYDYTASFSNSRSTSAYFSIVNAGAQPDALVAVSGDGIGSITLHQTTVDEQAVARMRGLTGIELRPHTRVDFAPAGNHVMLDGLSANLYEGDTVPLTLHFASGQTATLEFNVVMLTPEGRLNFQRIGDFQITNAWVRATASLDGLVAVSEGSYEWRLPQNFPLPRVPDNNPMTTEKVELGRYLFYDPRLSGNGTQSCSSCHLQALAFTDGRALPVGSTGDIHPRNSMTLTNTAYSATLTWANPNLLVLERQIPIPMFGEHPIELGITGNEGIVLSRFRDDPLYQTMFAAAFPDQSDPFTFNNIALALASFNRTLISGDSPYDQYVRGDTTALSESARRGMNMFFSESLECHHCHTGFNFTLSTVTANTTFADYPFFNTGLYNIGGTGAYPTGNTGIHEITNVASDMGRFRPPTLRNIALTAPYMHDGSFASLEEVIRFYADGGRVITEGDYAGDGRANPFKNGLVPGFSISDQEISDLVAFLESLTDEKFIHDSRFSDPFAGNAQQSD